VNFVVQESRPFIHLASHLRRPTTMGDMISARRYYHDEEEKEETIQEHVSVLEREDEVVEVDEYKK